MIFSFFFKLIDEKAKKRAEVPLLQTVVNLDPNTRRAMNKEMNWDSQIEIWREALLNLLRDFINGQKEIEPTIGSCKNCAFDSICRVNSSGG